MADDNIRAFTKAAIDEVLAAVAAPVSPSVILMSSYSKSVFTVIRTADAEVWDWRRTKRELRRLGLKRKGVRREYHKRALDG